MTPTQALAILREVAARHMGTLADHEQIQRALKVAAAAMAPPKPPAEAASHPPSEG